jgi:hypothetical protein
VEVNAVVSASGLILNGYHPNVSIEIEQHGGTRFYRAYR